MTDSLKLYSMIVSKESRRFFTYRGNIFAGCLTGLLMLAARYALWSALFATGNAQDATLTETMTFFVVNDLLAIWLVTWFGNTIGADIRSGDIAQRLIRPFPYQLQLIASGHADSITETITRGVPMLVAALIFIGLMPPVSASALAFFVITAILGGIIYALVDLIVSYTAFWLTEYWYLSWFRMSLFMLFGGTMLPLWFYPDWLLAICTVLPFQYSIFMPISIYLGRVPVSDAFFIIGMQLFWIVVLFVCERALWNLGQRKLVVQGG